jgi:signal transduction histidine kinase
MSAPPASGSELPLSERPSEVRRLTHARHELRTPLNAILGYAEMLLEDVQNAGQNDAALTLQDIIVTGNSILDSINLLTIRSNSEPGTDRRKLRDRAFSEIHAARERIERAVGLLRSRDGIMDLFSADVEAIESACVKLRNETCNEEARLRAIEQRMSAPTPSTPGTAL